MKFTTIAIILKQHPHATCRSLIVDYDETGGGMGRKDSTTIQYDNISQTGSVQSILSSDNDNENDDNTEENDAKELEQQDAQNHESKRMKIHKYHDHLKSQDFQVCVTIIEARQLPGKEKNHVRIFFYLPMFSFLSKKG